MKRTLWTKVIVILVLILFISWNIELLRPTHEGILNNTHIKSTDLLDLPPIKFLPEFRNPCMYVENRTGYNHVMCLPYFAVLGFPKCGTTDFYWRLKKHPEIVALVSKEQNWWRGSDPNKSMPKPLGNYLNQFQRNVDDIVSNVKVNEKGKQFHPKVFGDFSTRTLMNEQDPYVPNKMVWHKIHHVNPHTKFIIVMRDPVSRLYSDFIYFSGRMGVPKSAKTPGVFHKKVLEQIDWWNGCTKMHPINVCLFGPNITGQPSLTTYYKTCWQTNLTCAAFRIGFYAYYIKEWLSVFPKEQFLFIRTEDYGKDTYKSINEWVLPFLGLGKNSEDDVTDDVTNKVHRPHAETDKAQSPMYNETRELLQQLYKQSNSMLSMMLKSLRTLKVE